MGNTGSTYNGTRKVNSYRHNSKNGGGPRHRTHSTNNLIENEEVSSSNRNENSRGRLSTQNQRKTKRARKSKREQKKEKLEDEQLDEQVDDSI